MHWFTREGLISILVLVVLLFASVSFAVPFVATKDTSLLIAPSQEAQVIALLNAGEKAEVTALAGEYYKINTENGAVGYVKMTNLERVRQKDVPLVPIVIGSSNDTKKIVVIKPVKLINLMYSEAPKNILPGTEMTVSKKQSNKNSYWAMPNDGGYPGWVSKTDAETIRPISLATEEIRPLWGKGGVVSASSLGIMVWLERLDGTMIDDDTVLKIGDSYHIMVKADRDCYIRITSETPELKGFCQYYPNYFPGYTKSVKLQAGKVYSSEFLPPGRYFQVGEPIGTYDLIRVEATTEKPFIFISRGVQNQGCQSPPTRGGTFVNVEDIADQNPVPEVVVEQKVKTSK